MVWKQQSISAQYFFVICSQVLWFKSFVCCVITIFNVPSRPESCFISMTDQSNHISALNTRGSGEPSAGSCCCYREHCVQHEHINRAVDERLKKRLKWETHLVTLTQGGCHLGSAASDLFGWWPCDAIPGEGQRQGAANEQTPALWRLTKYVLIYYMLVSIHESFTQTVRFLNCYILYEQIFLK